MKDTDQSHPIPKSIDKPAISSGFLFSLCPTPYRSSTLRTPILIKLTFLGFDYTFPPISYPFLSVLEELNAPHSI